MAKLRLGTRASALARWQADWVAAQLATSGTEVEMVHITTQGDAVQSGPIGAIGGSGVFTKELQRALLEQRIDLAVHSLKDLPTDPVDGLSLAAVPEREITQDALVCREAKSLAELPANAIIGTGSLRRRAQLLFHRSSWQMRDVRGNVDTRLRKLREGQYDAIVLAVAGLKRLGFDDQITEVLPSELMLPAVGQGALGIETRTGDGATRAAVAHLNDSASHQAVLAERALLAALRGGCLAPVGAWARISGDKLLRLDAVVLSPDGLDRLTASSSRPMDEAIDLGQHVAEQLLSAGAAKLIDQARRTPPV